jgi:hypothetical protein
MGFLPETPRKQTKSLTADRPDIHRRETRHDISSVEARLTGDRPFGSSTGITADAQSYFALLFRAWLMRERVHGVRLAPDEVYSPPELGVFDRAEVKAALLRVSTRHETGSAAWRLLRDIEHGRLDECLGEDEGFTRFSLADRPMLMWLRAKGPKGPAALVLSDALANATGLTWASLVSLLRRDVRQQLTQGWSWIEAVAPGLITDVLPFTQTVGVLSKSTGCESLSLRTIPGVIFVNETLLAGNEGPAALGTALYHEMLHQKFYALVAVNPPVRPAAQGECLRPSWHPRDVAWPLLRALAACHVYVHLTLLHLRVSLERGRHVEQLATAEARSRFLSRELLHQHWGSLTDEGIALVRWLYSCVQSLTEVREELRLASFDVGGRART